MRNRSARRGSIERVAIVVLGEIDQSPRMRQHAEALASRDVEVDLVAYAGETTPAWLREHPRIRIWTLPAPGFAGRHAAPRAIFIAYALARLALVSLRLAWTLAARIPRPALLLAQTPPAIPTLLAVVVAARLRGARLVIDWHNYGYSMLALRLGAGHLAVRLARRHERWLGRFADHHLCVSRAMREDLERGWRLRGVRVLHDRPVHLPRRTSAGERRALFETCACLPPVLAAPLAEGARERPALLVSPTSWSADEDFGLLLEALPACEARIAAEERSAGRTLYPSFVVLLTGRGPLRTRYEERLAALALERFHVRTAWLDADRYRALLGCADLGLCFHTSSSGLDLPMKVADLHAAGLPVCAFDYGPCLEEMIVPGETGMLFAEAGELTRQICMLFKGYPAGAGALSRMCGSVMRTHRRRWDEEWQAVAAPLFGLAPG